MKPPRGLSHAETEAWAKLAATVRPLDSPPPGDGDNVRDGGVAPSLRHLPSKAPATTASPPRLSDPRVFLHQSPVGPPPLSGEDGLDSHWERRLRAGTLAPDFTVDLHEHSLDAAYQRLLGGLDIARETGARVVLVIAGRQRPGPAADRSGQRGAIRAKLLDWLAASRHGSAIAAIRNAHRRHGGDGALYVILKRARA